VRRIALLGVLAMLVAMAATTLAATLARAGGVSLHLPGAAEPIPVAGVGVMTGIFSLVGIVIALAVRRWAVRPAERWVQVAVALTTLSLVPPLLTGAGPATTVTLMALHLIAAAVMIPALARSLAVRTPEAVGAFRP
jgi:hypothetical protein